MKLEGSMFFAMILRCGAMAVLLGLAGACGDDPASDGAGSSDAGGAGLSGQDGGGAEIRSDAGEADGSVMASCAADEQDRDGDGVCSPVCSEGLPCGAGTCDDASGTARCVCPDGVAGEACDSCALGYAGEACDSCAAGFVEQDGSCIEDGCGELDCGDHGSCVQAIGDVSCQCNAGFSGELCDQCATGYTGDACDSCAAGFVLASEQGCVPNVCVGHSCGDWGTCIDDGGTPACRCDEGQTGDACDSCQPGYHISFESTQCRLRPPPGLQYNLVLWQDADDPTTLFLNGSEGVIAWRNKAPADNSSFGFPLDSTQKLSEDGGRRRIVFSGGDYATRTFSLPGASYSVYIVAKWQSDAEAGGNAPNQAILAGVDLDGALGHGLWYEARSDHQIRYRHRFPFGGGGEAVGDEVYASFYDANEGLQLITSQRLVKGNGYMRLYNGANLAELNPLTKTAFSDPMRLHLGVNGPSGAGALEGEIAEILIYKAAHGNLGRKSVEDYLRVKWSLAEPPPPKL